MSKPRRGRYGDGCIYLVGKTYWITRHEPQRLPGGTIVHQKCYSSTGSEDKKVAHLQLRAKLQAVGDHRRTNTSRDKITHDDLRQNLLEFCVTNSRQSLKYEPGTRLPTLDTLPRLDGRFSGWRASDITLDQLKRFRAEGKREGLSDQRMDRYMTTTLLVDSRFSLFERPPQIPTARWNFAPWEHESMLSP
jgi:hypothetical protein